jgi:hypothetical protein
MKLIEINKNSNSNELVFCYIIYFRLISEEYFIDKLLNFDIINPIIRDKGNKKNIMTSLRIKQLNILKKQNKILEYNPCTHLGNVPCNEFCPCFERGFCEKFSPFYLVISDFFRNFATQLKRLGLWQRQLNLHYTSTGMMVLQLSNVISHQEEVLRDMQKIMAV